MILVRIEMRPTSLCMTKPILCGTDSKGAIHVTLSRMINRAHRHLSARSFFIRTLVHEGLISLQHVSSSQSGPDGLTKPLQGSAFEDFLAHLGIENSAGNEKEEVGDETEKFEEYKT